MPLTYEHVGSKKPAKVNTYMLTRAELLITLCYEIPCSRTTNNLDFLVCCFQNNLLDKNVSYLVSWIIFVTNIHPCWHPAPWKTTTRGACYTKVTLFFTSHAQ